MELAGGPLPAPRRRPHRRTGTAGVPVIPSLSAASSGLRFVLLGFFDRRRGKTNYNQEEMKAKSDPSFINLKRKEEREEEENKSDPQPPATAAP